MKLSNAIKKLAKLGTVINKGQQYSVIHNDVEISCSQNGREDEAVCFHTRPVDQESDSMTDYFAGSFHNTLTAAIKFASY